MSSFSEFVTIAEGTGQPQYGSYRDKIEDGLNRLYGWYTAESPERIADKKDIYSFLHKIGRNRETSCLRLNDKTLLSIDMTMVCPKLAEGRPCPYCYVQLPRTFQKEKMHGFGGHPSKEIPELQYSGEIMEMPQSLIDILNFGTTGIRMFSFGDYCARHEPLLVKIFDDCRTRKLLVRAITKQPDFIARFAREYDDVFSVIDVSTDFELNPGVIGKLVEDPMLRKQISNAPTLEQAKILKAMYPKVRIRYVAMNPAEGEIAAKTPDIDVLTMYHGVVGKTLKELLRKQNPNLVNSMTPEEFQGWVDEIHKLRKGEVPYEEFEKKVCKILCCKLGVCYMCDVNCGVPRIPWQKKSVPPPSTSFEQYMKR